MGRQGTFIAWFLSQSLGLRGKRLDVEALFLGRFKVSVDKTYLIQSLMTGREHVIHEETKWKFLGNLYSVSADGGKTEEN